MTALYKKLVETTQRGPQREAVIEGETRWTYAQFLDQVDRAAAGFSALGIQPGDRVGMMLLNQKEFLVCFFALRKIGGVVVPINIQMLPQDIGFVVQNAGFRHLVIAAALYPNMAHLPLQMIVVGGGEAEAKPAVLSYEALLEKGQSHGAVDPVDSDPTGLAMLLYTSGTTGYPKGVMLSERNILANIEGFDKVVDFTEADRMILALPLFHAYGLIVALTGLVTGASLTLIPKFQPRSILEALIQEKATILPLVPTLYAVILEMIQKQGGVEVPHLRFCISGGASLPAELLHRIEAALNTMVLEGYGLTETSPVLAVNDPRVGSVPYSVGKPLPNVQIKIVHEDGSECATGEVGEVLAKGENVMLGYYNMPEETRTVMTEDGWFRTGDLGHLDEAGRLYISGGRKKDLIIKAGENISPRTIEEVLYRHEAIREAAVVGIPHEKLGEDIAACISLKEGYTLTAQEVLQYSREHLTGTYMPAHVEIMDELPKNPTGKIIKKLLKETLAQRVVPASKR